jgi:hypothetical protein
MVELATPSTGSRTWSLAEAILLSAIAGVAAYAADDWIAIPAVVILWLAWRYLRDSDGLPILPMAMTFQWVQVTAGIWYFAATGRRLLTMDISDYRPMVLIGLACVASLMVGLSAGINIMRRARPPKEVERHETVPIGWPGLLAIDVGILALQVPFRTWRTNFRIHSGDSRVQVRASCHSVHHSATAQPAGAALAVDRRVGHVGSRPRVSGFFAGFQSRSSWPSWHCRRSSTRGGRSIGSCSPPSGSRCLSSASCG